TQQFHCHPSVATSVIDQAASLLNNLQSYYDLNTDQRSHMRRLLTCAAEITTTVAKQPETSAEDRYFLYNLRK
ncbi:MAG: anion permease, partial [Candidatus Regiella insecticola]|nr:anion permease [Candidatus Regiella insecticola]